MTVVFVWLTEPSARLAVAQEKLEQSIRSFGLSPLRYPAGKQLAELGDVLRRGREETEGDAFVWCNSDVVLTKNPFEVPDPGKCYGFHRTELPSKATTYGVDMYYIPTRSWDSYLSRDVPRLYIGASFVDWWISRAMAGRGAYENLTGYIDHVSHGQSHAAIDDTNKYYQANFRAYNAWARRSGADPIPAPPFLIPRIGHVWGVRDALRKVVLRRRTNSR